MERTKWPYYYRLLEAVYLSCEKDLIDCSNKALKDRLL